MNMNANTRSENKILRWETSHFTLLRLEEKDSFSFLNLPLERLMVYFMND